MARLKSNADLVEMIGGATVPVINGCCNLYHPCQTLADMLAIAEDRGGDPRGARLTYVGAYNNVVNSLVSICAALGVELTLVCPIRDEASVDGESRSRLLGLGLLTETLDLEAAVVGRRLCVHRYLDGHGVLQRPLFRRGKGAALCADAALPAQRGAALRQRSQGHARHADALSDTRSPRSWPRADAPSSTTRRRIASTRRRRSCSTSPELPAAHRPVSRGRGKRKGGRESAILSCPWNLQQSDEESSPDRPLSP